MLKTHKMERIAKGLIFSSVFMVGSLLLQGAAYGQDKGKELFQNKCAACHTVGKGRLVGPDLAGVHEKRTEKWIINFVKSSQSVVKKGDKEAVAIFEEYNKIVMPDQPLTDDQIKSIIAFIKSEGPAPVAADKEPEQPAKEYTEEEIKRGQELFQGNIRFVNKGPTCISCHNVKNDAVIGGGILAKDLTSVFTRLNDPGVRAILGSAPFPVMEQAYKDKALTKEEINDLVAFLQYADKERFYQHPRDYGWRLFNTGVVGTVVLFGLFGMMGMRRKKKAVADDIFKRQEKTLGRKN